MSSDANSALDIHRKAAKRLKKACAAGGPAALSRLHAHVPADKPVKHADCLFVVAREAGYESWPQLKFAIELQSLTRAQRAKQLETALANGRHRVTEKLLREEPGLADEHLGLQIALYDLAAVKAALDVDPSAAIRIIGVRPPIVHLAFSKEIHRRPEAREDMLAIAELLVTNGADVNDGYRYSPGDPNDISVLYGALCHADNFELGCWLLEKGADPNDDESLYHATELGHTRALKLLLKHGARVNGTNALPRAIDFNDARMVQLLLDHGADPNISITDHPSGQPVDGIPALHQTARRWASAEIAEVLLDHGADPTLIWNGHTAYALARIYGNRQVAACLERRGASTSLSSNESLLADCAEANCSGAKLDKSGLTGESRRLLTRLAAVSGKLEHIKVLVGASLDPNETEEMGLPALQVAAWNGLAEEVAYFLELEPDLEHRNAYGGNAIETLIHGAEHAPRHPGADHIACAGLLLQAGSKINISHVRACGAEDLSLYLESWLEG